MDDATTSTLISYLTDGKYLLVVGMVLVLLAQLARTGLGAWIPWFKTQLGGYVVGFGTSAIVYFGTALQQGAAITFRLVSICLVMAFAASGKYHAVRDLATAVRKRPVVGGVVKVTLFALMMISISSAPIACATLKADGKIAEASLINCGKQNFLGLIGDTFKALNGGSLSDYGKTVGSDALACAVRAVVAVEQASLPHGSRPSTALVNGLAFLKDKQFADAATTPAKEAP